MTVQIPAFTTDQLYPWWVFRKQMASLVSPGIVNPTDLLVSPASGLQVQIAAGTAFVQQTVETEAGGANSFYNGLYTFFNDSAANPYNTITAPVSNPRIDQVILRVYDVQEQGLGGSSKGQIEWLVGSETAGATITPGAGYLAGAAALPANSYRLAYVQQNVAEVSITSGQILNVALPARSQPALAKRTIASGGQTLNPGDLAICVPGITINLPPFGGLSPNTLVGVVANGAVSGASPVTVASGSLIYGPGMIGVNSFLLGTAQVAVQLLWDGTEWEMISGQQDTGWVALGLVNSWTSSGGYTPSIRLIGERVYFKGSVTAPSGGTTIATLITTFRPAAAVEGPLGFLITAAGVMTATPPINLPLSGFNYTLS